MNLFNNFICDELGSQPLLTCHESISKVGNPLTTQFLNLTRGIDQILPERKKELEAHSNLGLTIAVETTTDKFRFSVNPCELTVSVSLA